MREAEKHFVKTRRADEAAELCARIEALSDHAYPAWYRRKLAVTLTRRALERACV
jgi:CO/xanthine dehydrogenase FAD-binding subunit